MMPKIGDIIEFKSNVYYDNKLYIRKILNTQDKVFNVNIISNSSEPHDCSNYSVYIDEITRVLNKEENPEYFL